MKKTQLIELIVLCVVFVGSVGYLYTSGTLTIRAVNSNAVSSATVYGVSTSSPTAVSGSLIISPYDAKDEIISYIAGAKYTLDGWFYQITDTDILQALDLKAQTGVENKLIIERSMYGGNTKSYDTLVKKLKPNSRITIKSDDHLGVNFNHTKAFVRDDEDIMIATANLSYPSFSRNREHRVVVQDKAVVDSVRQLFDDDRKGESISPKTIHPSLLVCPINCRAGLDALLGDVNQSVRMQAQYIEDDSVIERLHELKNIGIEIRLLVGEFQDEQKLQGLPYRIQKNLYNHSKALYIDGEHVLIGSMNYSTNSIEENREISVLLDNPRTLGLFRWQFEQDWEESE